MFKTFLIVIVLFIFSSCNEKEVPEEIKAQFLEMEPLAQDIEWLINKGLYKTYYTINKCKKTSYFDKKGNWLETETEITKEELAPAIIEVLNNQFFEYTIKDIELVETFDRQILYEVDLQKDGKKYDILFDESGKILRKKL
ncbi:MAG: hypothetical protein DRJ10_04335 [Bacteroidetes bacterium]|nr:MAG: hypothetical protein DRJ10_04335 [Bacteroidota bacterium]